MRRPVEDRDYSNQTITGLLEGYYLNCNFNGAIFKDCTIKAVFKNCSARGITLSNAKIVTFHTPGTEVSNTIIDKPSFQPIHFALIKSKLLHNHQYITGKIRDYANANLRDPLKTTILRGCDFIDAHPEMSWNDFLLTDETPKEMWDLAELFFPNDKVIREFAVRTREVRWPSTSNLTTI